MSETTKPRNVDGQIVCPPGYDLKPDGLCYAQEGLIAKVEHALEAGAETLVHEVKALGEAIVEKVEEVLGLETKSETKEPEAPVSEPPAVVVPATVPETKPDPEKASAETLNVAVETPKPDESKHEHKDKANAGSDSER